MIYNSNKNIPKDARFTAEQLETLRPFEHAFATVLRSDYASRIGGPRPAQLISDTYFAATGVRLRAVASCQDCMTRLLKAAGKLYFASLKAEEVEKAPAAKKVATSTRKAAPRKAVKVETAETAK